MIRCLLVSGIFPPDIGGPATYVPAIARSLQERGFSCSVLTLGDSTHPTPSFPFPVHYVSRAHTVPVRMTVTVGALQRLARQADVILANGLHVEAAIAAGLARRPLVTKVVGDEVWDRASRLGWTTNSLDAFQSAPSGFAVSALKSFRRRALSASRTIIVPSQYTADLVAGWVSKSTQVIVIPNSVEPKNVRTPFVLNPEFRSLRRIAFVGRLIALKRVDHLLSMVATMPDVALVVAGDGPERAMLMKMASDLRIENRVQFTGAISDEAVWSVLGQCSLLVLNSTTENCPHVVLEAMAMGLPVVATRVGGVPEIVEDEVTGVLVNPHDPTELRAAIRRVLDDPRSHETLGAAAQAAVSRFSWCATADSVAAVLRQSCTS